jgi:hypothetical protein
MSTHRFTQRRRLTRALGVLLPLGLLAAGHRPASAAPLVLVTADEARRYAEGDAAADPLRPRLPEPDFARDRMLPRALPEPAPGPRIDLLRPALDTQPRLRSPFPIEVRFIPLPDAAVDPASFRVLYGNLRLDVTARILAQVKVAAAGFSLAEAAIPAGRHRLLLRVGDQKQRTGELDLRFEVE